MNHPNRPEQTIHNKTSLKQDSGESLRAMREA
jgi:hypothetical protein